MDERIIELESKLTFTEDLLDQLNGVVTAQERRIVELEKTVAKLEEQLALHGGIADGSQQKPPHY